MTAPATSEEFVEWIARNPSDLSRRQAFADWLLEKGDPLGELIALQFASANETRQQELLSAHGATWAEPLGPAVVPRWSAFRKGALEVLGLAPQRKKDLPRRKEPRLALVTDLLLHGPASAGLDDFLAKARLDSVSHLTAPDFTLTSIPSLMRARLTTLAVLVTRLGIVGDGSLSTFLRWARIPELRRLLILGDVEDRAFGSILRTLPAVQRLHHIGIESSQRVGYRTVSFFGDLAELPELHRLDLAGPNETFAPGDSQRAAFSYHFSRKAAAWRLLIHVRAIFPDFELRFDEFVAKAAESVRSRVDEIHLELPPQTPLSARISRTLTALRPGVFVVNP